MARATVDPVLIVGAGPSGLLLAIELARRSVPFRLVDRLERRAEWARATVVKSRSMEVFAAIGVEDAFLEQGQRVEGVDVYADSERAASYRFGALDTPFPFILSIPEDETERILTARLADLGGNVERGVEFLGLKDTDQGITAKLRDPVSGERELAASWVVGTDGFHSSVREAADDAFEGRDYVQFWGVVDARVPGWTHARDIVCAQLEPPVVIPFPLAPDRWRIYFRTDVPDADALAGVEKRLALISPGAGLEDPDEPKFFHAHSRVARRFRTGRALVAGDAAHVVNPIEGHGMNAGIQDAFNLGWKLALVLSEDAAGTLVDSYEPERRPVAQALLKSGDEAEDRASPGASDARQELFQFLSTAKGQALAALAESELAFGYERSPIVAEIGDPPPASECGTMIGHRVGDATDLVGHDGVVRLHNVLTHAGHTLLLLLGNAMPNEAAASLSALLTDTEPRRNCMRTYAVSRLPTPEPLPEAWLWDRSGSLHGRLSGDAPTLCLIRPDGHLGFRCAPASGEALSGYLARVLPRAL